ncbi:MAG: hypothetical protein HYZ58_15635 [Acidobacteria bacterium]|nr:hypothetical protein [Acidobacteriota bacterium]
MLIAYSIINRSFILDLLAGFSFVEHLLDQGLDVYIIEWGEAKSFVGIPGDREHAFRPIVSTDSGDREQRFR